jgi:hypothetical protein
MPADSPNYKKISPKYQNCPRGTKISSGQSAGGPGIRFYCPTLTRASGHTGVACPHTRQNTKKSRRTPRNRRSTRNGMPADLPKYQQISPKYQNSPRGTKTSNGQSADGPGIRFYCPMLTRAGGHTGAACPRTRQSSKKKRQSTKLLHEVSKLQAARARAVLGYDFTAHVHTRRRPRRSGMPADSSKFSKSSRNFTIFPDNPHYQLLNPPPGLNPRAKI